MEQLVYFAQAYKIFKTHSAKDVSLFAFVIGFISVASWLVYGISEKDKPLILANTVAVIGVSLLIVGIIMYK